MPYDAPELLLVGAAQNLVLNGTSDAFPGEKSAQQRCTNVNPIDDIGNLEEYQVRDSW